MPNEKKNELAVMETTVMTTAQTGAMAQAKATISAQYEMAMHRPRLLDQVRLNLLGLCSHPRFAAQARYHLPIGNGVQGWSIRFAEAAIASMGNINVVSHILDEDNVRRMIRITVVDLERNTAYSHDISLEKTVERRHLRKGQVPIATRTNSEGQTTFLVPATERDLAMKQNAEESKAMRTLGLRLIPAFLLDECLSKIEQTMAQDLKANPHEARNQLVEAFASVGVQPTQLAEVLGHSLDHLSPHELQELRAAYSAIKDGVLTWREFAAMKGHDASGGSKGGEDDPHADTRSRVAERLRKRAKTKSRAAEPPPDSSSRVDETQRLIEQGWELDPNTGELVPPPGVDG